jgi:signal transduction histidine kinase
MLHKNLLIGLVSVLFFCGGLIFWQLDFLQEIRRQRKELFEEEAKKKLHEIASILRLDEEWQIAISPECTPEEQCEAKLKADSLLALYFPKYKGKIWWGITKESETKPAITNAPENLFSQINQSEIRTCYSCLIKISFVDSNLKDKIVSQSPAQMLELYKDEDKELSYMKLYFEPYGFTFSFTDYLAFLFIIGISILFSLLLHLNAKQKKLIEQKNEFINHLSHQFKTPLASIRLGTKMLLKTAENPRQLQMLELMNVEGSRLENHIQTVMHWVKSGAQGLQLSPKAEDIEQIVRKGIQQMEPVFKDKQTQVELYFEEHLPLVYADAYHLTLALFNLWENAVKHNASALHLKISVFRQGKYIVVKSEDKGKGFDQKKVKDTSAGLGLLYVERVVKDHKGIMEIFSQAGKGTIFTIKLQLA